MFTGIIEELGNIQEIKSNKITVKCGTIIQGAKLGDSIAVNGVCLTVSEILSDGFVADISPETFKVTTFNLSKTGDLVNLERAMPANGRFGGHIVSGHIDGLAKILDISKTNNFYELNLELDAKESNYAIKKGSITINGISLTIANIEKNTIKLAIIPHTYENTNLKTLKNGNYVNIEVDMVAKYIEKFLSSRDNKSKISLEFLQEHGF